MIRSGPDFGEVAPRLSIIIPTYNRADRVLACVGALCSQTAAPDQFEVIVVVDGSTDRTVESLATVEPPYALTVLVQDNQGWSSALNHGVSRAMGQVCLFLDDDIVPDRLLVAEHLRAHQEDGGLVGIGRMTLNIPDDADWFVRAYSESWSAHYASLNQGRAPCWADCYGGNLSVPRGVVLQVGGMPLGLARGRDIEFGYRLQTAGMRFRYLSRAIGHQDERKTFRELAVDAEKAGGAWVEIYRRHPPVLPELFAGYHHTRLLSKLLQGVGLSLSLSPRAMRALIEMAGKRDYRAFHFLRGYCYWRGVKRAAPRDLWRRLVSGPRILMYHAFAGPGEVSGRYVVSLRSFARQLRWLRRLGFQFIELGDYLEIRSQHLLPPARSIVITVDDGYRDFRDGALPVLDRMGVPATLFVVTGRVGGRNEWSTDSHLAGRPLLTWSELEQLKTTGIEMGAHTRSHANLADLSESDAMAEIRGSRSDLEDRLGVRASAFAYPYGAESPRLRELAGDAGFGGSCGIEPGICEAGAPAQSLPRLEIFGTDSLPTFLAKVWMGMSHMPWSRRS